MARKHSRHSGPLESLSRCSAHTLRSRATPVTPARRWGNTSGSALQCFSCHAREFQQNGVLDHRAAGFPTTCETCHNADRWQIGAFRSHPLCQFRTHRRTPESGLQHLPRGQPFPGRRRRDCASCHLSDFTKTTNPNHVAAGFSHDCSTCHNTCHLGRRDLQSQPDQVPTHRSTHHGHVPAMPHQRQLHQHQHRLRVLPLKGLPGHDRARITSRPASRRLVSYATPPRSGWGPPSITTPPSSRSPALTRPLTCAQCHSSGQYATLSTTCSSCHLKDYQGTNNPNHVAAGFPQDCQLCHTTTRLAGATFDHNADHVPADRQARHRQPAPSATPTAQYADAEHSLRTRAT